MHSSPRTPSGAGWSRSSTTTTWVPWMGRPIGTLVTRSPASTAWHVVNVVFSVGP